MRVGCIHQDVVSRNAKLAFDPIPQPGQKFVTDVADPADGHGVHADDDHRSFPVVKNEGRRIEGIVHPHPVRVRGDLRPGDAGAQTTLGCGAVCSFNVFAFRCFVVCHDERSLLSLLSAK